jgi:uncharacterized protein YxeA
MKAVLIIVCGVLFMIVFGWLTFSHTDNQATIHIETQKIQSDTQHANEQGEQSLKKVEAKGRELLSQPAKS